MALAPGQTGHLADHQEAVYQVDHGATAGTSRPTLGSASTAPSVVLWNGTVEPTNAVDGDWWFDEDNSLVKVKVSGSFVGSGTGTYRSDDTPLYVPVEPFVGTGAATLANFQSRASSISFAASGDTKSVGLATDIPDEWSTFDIYGLFGDESGGVGDAVFQLWTADWSSETVLSLAETDQGTTTVTAIGTAAKYQEVLLASGVTHTEGRPLAFRFWRLGDDGGDDFASAMHLVGRALIFKKAS